MKGEGVKIMQSEERKKKASTRDSEKQTAAVDRWMKSRKGT
jgi:hypothetical protein